MKQREIIMSLKIQGIKYDDIAKEVGVSRQNIYMVVHKGRLLKPANLLKLQKLAGFSDEVLKELMEE